MNPPPAATAAKPRPKQLSAADRPEPVPFGPGSMVWDDFGDVFSLLLGQGAFVLQSMHPTIAAAVDAHSVFREDPGGRAVRSLDSVMLWIYGGQGAIEEGKRLRELHKPIRGYGADGEPYSALNREAYAWVHQTAFVTAVQTARHFRGRPMTDEEENRFYDEMLQLGDILGIRRSDMPPNKDEYWPYYREMVATRLERNVVTDDLLGMIAETRVPNIPSLLRPLFWGTDKSFAHTMWLLTVGGMTPDAREVLGVDWRRDHDHQLAALCALIRPIHARLDERRRYVPLAYHARRHAEELAAARRRATPVDTFAR